jgi:hypothetical protein
MAKDVVVGDEDIEEERGAGEVISVEDLLAIDALDEVYIRLPEPWKGGVRARPLTNAEVRQILRDNMIIKRDKRGRVVSQEEDTDGSSADLIAASLIDPALTKEQARMLFLKNNKLASTLLNALQELNAIGEQGEQEAVDKAEAAFREG